jgi:hypothetical protein
MRTGFGKGPPTSGVNRPSRRPVKRLHLLRPGGLANNIGADGDAFRVP